MPLLQILDSQHNLIVLASLFIGLFSMMDTESKRILAFDFQNKKFLMYVSGILIFSYLVFRTSSTTEKQRRLKEATRKALAALLVAYLAHLNMVFAPFFTVFALDYFLSSWA